MTTTALILWLTLRLQGLEMTQRNESEEAPMAYDQSNVFAKVLRGEIPCHKIYEDDRSFAFLDIMPPRPRRHQGEGARFVRRLAQGARQAGCRGAEARAGHSGGHRR